MPRRSTRKTTTRRTYSKATRARSGSRSYSARRPAARRKSSVSKRSGAGRPQRVQIELIQTSAPAVQANPLVEMIAQAIGSTTAPTSTKKTTGRKF